TLLFKSPTCTKEDEAIARMLAEIADVDIEKYGIDMLKAGTDLSDKTLEELLTMDAKEFTMGDAKVEIAQVNAVDIAEIYQEQDEIEAAIQKVIDEKDLDLFLLVVTDIINSNSEVLALGNSSKNVEDAFQVQLLANRA